MKSFRKIMYVFLCLCIMFIPEATYFGAEQKAVDTNSQEIMTANGIEVNWQVKERQQDCYDVDLTLTNTTEEIIKSWGLKFKLDNMVLSIKNEYFFFLKSAIVTKDDKKKKLTTAYHMHKVGDEQDLKPHESITLHLSGENEGEMSAPYDLEVYSGNTALPENSYEVICETKGKWQEGKTAVLHLFNKSEEDILNWQLEFDYAGEIGEFWEAKIVSHNMNHYVIQNLDFNSIIMPMETYDLGFYMTSDNEAALPTNFKLKGFKVKKDQWITTDFYFNDEMWDAENVVMQPRMIYYQKWSGVDCVTEDILLVKKMKDGTPVNWSSSNPQLIDENGHVTRPQDKTQQVTLTASYVSNGSKKQVPFKLKVIRKPDETKVYAYNSPEVKKLSGSEEAYVQGNGQCEINCVGIYSNVKVECPEDAIRSLYSVSDLLKMKDINEEVACYDLDKFNGCYCKLQQYYKGIKVLDHEIKVSASKQGEANSLISSYDPNVNLSEIVCIPKIKAEQAEKMAKEKFGNDVKIIERDVVVYSNYDLTPRLVWYIATEDPISKDINYLYVDAINGEVVKQYMLDKRFVG